MMRISLPTLLFPALLALLIPAAALHAVTTPGVNGSIPGFDWTLRNAASADAWEAVTYGNGLFVAVAGTNGAVMTSPDGITWTPRTAAADSDWVGVTYGNGLFVAVADTGTGNRVMTSPDGITWTSRNAAVDIRGIGVTAGDPVGNGVFVAVA